MAVVKQWHIRLQYGVIVVGVPPRTISGLPPPSAQEVVTAVHPCRGPTGYTGWTPRRDIIGFTNPASDSPVEGVAQDYSNVRVCIVWEELPVGIASLMKHRSAVKWIPAYRVAQLHHRCAHPLARSRCCHSMILLLSITAMSVKAPM